MTKVGALLRRVFDTSLSVSGRGFSHAGSSERSTAGASMQGLGGRGNAASEGAANERHVLSRPGFPACPTGTWLLIVRLESLTYVKHCPCRDLRAEMVPE